MLRQQLKGFTLALNFQKLRTQLTSLFCWQRKFLIMPMFGKKKAKAAAAGSSEMPGAGWGLRAASVKATGTPMKGKDWLCTSIILNGVLKKSCKKRERRFRRWSGMLRCAHRATTNGMRLVMRPSVRITMYACRSGPISPAFRSTIHGCTGHVCDARGRGRRADISLFRLSGNYCDAKLRFRKERGKPRLQPPTFDSWRLRTGWIVSNLL